MTDCWRYRNTIIPMRNCGQQLTFSRLTSLGDNYIIYQLFFADEHHDCNALQCYVCTKEILSKNSLMLKIVEKEFVKYFYVLYQALSRDCHLTNKRSIYSNNCIFSIFAHNLCSIIIFLSDGRSLDVVDLCCKKKATQSKLIIQN